MFVLPREPITSAVNKQKRLTPLLSRTKRAGAFLPRPYPVKAQRSGFDREKEEGRSVFGAFSARRKRRGASFFNRTPVKAQRSGFDREKEEGRSVFGAFSARRKRRGASFF
jgi:hypothetical protein